MTVILIWDGPLSERPQLRFVVGPFDDAREASHWADNSLYDYWTVRQVNDPAAAPV